MFSRTDASADGEGWGDGNGLAEDSHTWAQSAAPGLGRPQLLHPETPFVQSEHCSHMPEVPPS
jgi:hypothetical protein